MTHTHRIVRALAVVVAAAILTLPLHAQPAIAPDALSVATTDDATYFRIVLTPDIPVPAWPTVGDARIITHPSLLAPDDATTCWYAGRDTFIGRTTLAPGPLDLTLRARDAEGHWSRFTCHVDLAEADAWDEADPQTAWARAWFNDYRLRSRAITVGRTWYAYAARRIAEIHNLDERDDDRFNAGLDNFAPPTRYDTIIGSAAIQETLQLERMLNTSSRDEERTIPIDAIEGVTVPSHDYPSMLKGATPRHSTLATLIPADQYYARFASLRLLFETGDLADAWGPTLLRATDGVGLDYQTRTRILRQLCLVDDARVRSLGPGIISEVAVTGCDPFLNSGGDLALILSTKSRQLIEGILNMPHNRARMDNLDATRAFSEHRGLRIESLVTPDRSIACHRVWLDDVYICANSLTALHRIIDAAQRERPRLADAPDFHYFRAVIYPMTDDEQVFLYLSEDFIRHITGPRMRIGWNRRLEAAASLGILRHAALLHATMTGDVPATIGEMSDSRALDILDLYDPEEGDFHWNPDTFTPSSTTWNTLAHLTPLIEVDVDHVTPSEADAYNRFRDRYTSFWDAAFDPIGARLTLADDLVRLDLHITPLIQSRWYEEQRGLVGGDPLPISLAETPDGTILRFLARLNRGRSTRQAIAWGESMLGNHQALDWVGDWVTFAIGDRDAFSDVMRDFMDISEDRDTGGLDDVFRMTLTIGAHVSNRLHLAAFLTSLRAAVDTVAPNLVEFNRRDDHQGVGIVQIAPTPESELNNFIAPPDAEPDAEPFTPALYYATIADGWFLSTQEHALHRRIDATLVKREPDPDDLVHANALIDLDVSADRGLNDLLLELATHRARRQVHTNLEVVRILGDAHLLDGGEPVNDVVQRVFTYRLTCPYGGTYTWDPLLHAPVSSALGHADTLSADLPLPEDAPLHTLIDPLQRLIAFMRFTDDDGLAATLRIHRQPESDAP